MAKEKTQVAYNEISLDTAAEIIKCSILEGGATLPVMLWGSPGIGKSGVTTRVGQEMNAKVINLRLTSREAVDLSGLPMPLEKDGCYTYSPLDIFLLENADEKTVEKHLTRPDGGKYDYIIYFLDELSSVSSEDMKAALYKFILDREVGEHKLHEKTRIVCAGNRSTDRAIVNDLGTALTNRLEHIHVAFDHKVQMQYMVKTNWHKLLLAFHAFTEKAGASQSGYLYVFNPERKQEGINFATPRTWESVNNILNSAFFETISKQLASPKKEENLKAQVLLNARFTGLLGAEVASVFIDFLKHFFNMPDVSVIENNPENAKLPNSASEAYAIGSYLMSKILEPNLTENIGKYLIRIAKETNYLEIAKSVISYVKAYEAGSSLLEKSDTVKELIKLQR